MSVLSCFTELFALKKQQKGVILPWNLMDRLLLRLSWEHDQ